MSVGKREVGQETVNQPNFYFRLSQYLTHRKTAALAVHLCMFLEGYIWRRNQQTVTKADGLSFFLFVVFIQNVNYRCPSPPPPFQSASCNPWKTGMPKICALFCLITARRVKAEATQFKGFVPWFVTPRTDPRGSVQVRVKYAEVTLWVCKDRYFWNVLEQLPSNGPSEQAHGVGLVS